MKPIPPKPFRKARRLSPLAYLRAFRRDLLSAQPERLFAAKMAEYRTPFFRSYLLGEPELIDLVLRARPQDFPKSDRVSEGLRPLLRRAVFLSNGADWARQRRIIDPAFEGGRLRATYPSMQEAAQAMIARLTPGRQDVEPILSHVAADVIFRTLFSVPIEDRLAAEVFAAFRTYQRRQPILNAGAFLRLAAWVPRGIGRRGRRAATAIRAAITALVEARAAELAAGTAPDDLATKIMTTADPATGELMATQEIVDQVAILFLAGHETSASAMAWALYLLSLDPDAQRSAAAEAKENPEFSDISGATFIRNALREALRLYPPVPMMVREATRDETFRGRRVAAGSPLVISPWHTHRNPRLWEAPDKFDPDRFARPGVPKSGYLPFSAGPRICPGAGFAMVEMTLILSVVLARFELRPMPGREPVPVAHLTVRGRDGIWLELQPRRAAPKT
ncbi:MAG: cytochrome P450 [Pseudomonadota bacterium]